MLHKGQMVIMLSVLRNDASGREIGQVAQTRGTGHWPRKQAGSEGAAGFGVGAQHLFSSTYLLKLKNVESILNTM